MPERPSAPGGPGPATRPATGQLESCAECGHSRAEHEVKEGYKPYGYCNHGWDLCGCKKFVPRGSRGSA
jgi:hypothetical protein